MAGSEESLDFQMPDGRGFDPEAWKRSQEAALHGGFYAPDREEDSTSPLLLGSPIENLVQLSLNLFGSED